MRSSSQLQSLDISHNFASIHAVYSLKAMTNLNALNISCLKNVYSMEDYTNLVWRNLKEFRMGGLVCLESADIAQTIANSILTLKTLELGECSLCSADLDVAISSALRATEESQFDQLLYSDNDSKSVIPFTPLKLLNLSWCDDLSSTSIFSLLCRSPNIHTLILQKSCILSQHVSLISNYCPLIEELNLALCSGMC